MTILIIWIGMIAATVAATWLLSRKKIIRMPKPLLAACAIAFCVGSILTVVESQRLTGLMTATKWPSVSGDVLSAKIEGERAFYPMITYRFSLGDSTYTDSTDLGVPGFGNKFVRLDVAQKTVAEFPEGRSVTVHYDPANPHRSTLQPTPPWNVFVQLAFGMTLSILGAVGLSIRLSATKK